jgi:hypothetical protein
MWDDTSKLGLDWRLPEGARVEHDIPFGVVDARPGRPMHASTWVGVTSPSGEGFVIVHYGTPKFLYQGDRLVSVLAWGGRTFTNRMSRRFAEAQQFDLRVNGRHVFHFRVIPVPAGTSIVQRYRLAQAARAYYHPLVGRPLPKLVVLGSGAPLNLAEPLVSTSIERRDGGMRLRVLNCGGGITSVRDAFGPDWHVHGTSLAGTPLAELKPWAIAHLTLVGL